MPRATVILPCAGSGSRLGLPYPKELVPLGPGRLLVDATLDLLAPAAAAGGLNLVVVTRPDRLATPCYIQRRCAGTPLAFVFQPETMPGLYGAIRSALPWCAEACAVLLPDEVVEPAAEPADPFGELLASLRSHPVAFLGARVADPRRLAHDGALALDSRGRVVGYADKAGDSAAGFDAVWSGFAFVRDVAPELLDVMEAAQGAGALPRAQLERARLAGAACVPLAASADLGTWPRLSAYWARSGLAPIDPARHRPEHGDGEHAEDCQVERQARADRA